MKIRTWFSDGFGVGIVIFSSGYQTFPGLPSTCLIAIAEGMIEVLACNASVGVTRRELQGTGGLIAYGYNR